MTKKLLSFIIAINMFLSLVPAVFATSQFTDSSHINPDYVDSVNTLVELGILSGYPDGSFRPKNNITRAEFAKLAYILKYGSDEDSDIFAMQRSSFTDVEGNPNVAWAKGYINYCKNQGIISGVGNNKFNPQGNITVAEAAKMILVILGCDPAKEGFTGANWAANVTSVGIKLGLFNGWSGDPTASATRELVAKLIGNSLSIPKVLPEFDYNSVKLLTEEITATIEATTRMTNNLTAAMKNPLDNESIYYYYTKILEDGRFASNCLTSAINRLKKHAPIALTDGSTLLDLAEETYSALEKVLTFEMTEDNAHIKLVQFYTLMNDYSFLSLHVTNLVIDFAEPFARQ